MASKPSSPMFEVVEKLDVEAVRALARLESVNVNARDSRDQTVLHVVCQLSSLQEDGSGGVRATSSPVLSIVDALIRARADINAQDSRGCMPLHLLAKAGSLPVIDRLLQEENVDINAADEAAMTPGFYMMCHTIEEVNRSAYVSTLHRMLELSADFHRKNFNGDTMLHYAALYDNTSATAMLLSDAVGISANVTNHAGETPLFFAINRKAEAAVRLLLEYDANPLWESNSGEVAYSLAQQRDIDLSLLQQAKAAASAGVKPSWLKRVDSVVQLPSNALPKASIGGLFKELLQLAQQHRHAVDLKKVKRSHGQELCGEVERLVCRLVEVQYGTCNVTAAELSWAFLFNKRMLQAMNVLSTDLQSVLCSLLDLSLSMNKFQHPEITLELIESMLEYLQTHRQDPDNSLIGLRPEWGLLSEMNMDLIAMYTAIKSLGGPCVVFPHEDVNTGPDSLSGMASQSSPLHQELQSYTGGFPEIRKDALANVVNSLRFVNGDGELKRKVDQLSFLLRQERLMAKIWKGRTIEPYDLVICLTEESDGYRYSYLRFTGVVLPNDTLSVFTIPGEMMTRSVHASQVLPLTPSMLSSLGAVKSMSKMVDGPANEMIRTLNLFIREEQQKFMASKGVDVELLQSLGAACMTTNLKPLQEQLVHMLDNFEETFQPFFRDTRAYLLDRYTEMRANLFAIDTVFHPTRDIELSSVLNIPLEVIVKDRIKHSLETCQALSESVNQLRADLINGSWRQTLTEWRLDLVEKVTHTFLAKIGYSSQCVPDDIDEEPNDIDLVRHNLELLDELLDRTTDKHGVQKMIESLRNRIQPQIDEFIAIARFMIQDLLGISGPRNSAEIRLHMSSSLHLQPEQMEQVLGLGNDLEYLDAVKQLETTSARHRSASRQLNIVPISGLVMGTFYRLESEVKTVLEVWAPNMIQTNVAPDAVGQSSDSSKWSTADPRRSEATALRGRAMSASELRSTSGREREPMLSPMRMRTGSREPAFPVSTTRLQARPLAQPHVVPSVLPVPLPELPSAFAPCAYSSLALDASEPSVTMQPVSNNAFQSHRRPTATTRQHESMVGSARKTSAPPPPRTSPKRTSWTRSKPPST